MYSFRSRQGGTTTLEMHNKSHDGNDSVTAKFSRSLPPGVKSRIAQSSALAVALDGQPRSFCSGSE